MNDREKEEKEEIDFNEGLQFGLSHTVNNKKKNEGTLTTTNYYPHFCNNDWFCS